MRRDAAQQNAGIGAKEIYLPDGCKGYAIVCAGAYSTWRGCLETAGNLCREKGYNAYMMDKSTGQLTLLFATETSASGTSSPTTTRELVITCKD